MDVCTPSTPPQHTHMQRENTKIWMDRGRGVTRKGWEDKERCEEKGERVYTQVNQLRCFLYQMLSAS